MHCLKENNEKWKDKSRHNDMATVFPSVLLVLFNCLYALASKIHTHRIKVPSVWLSWLPGCRLRAPSSGSGFEFRDRGSAFRALVTGPAAGAPRANCRDNVHVKCQASIIKFISPCMQSGRVSPCSCSLLTPIRRTGARLVSRPMEIVLPWGPGPLTLTLSPSYHTNRTVIRVRVCVRTVKVLSILPIFSLNLFGIWASARRSNPIQLL